MAFKLLSCDGGGVRGYISSSLIQALNTATHGKLLNNVQGFAGTSTGGLISIALANGVDIAKVVDIYKNDAAKIFTKNGWFTEADRRAQVNAAMLAGSELEGPGYLGSAYKATGLVEILTPYVGDNTFGDVKKVLAVNTAQLQDTSLTYPRWTPQTLNNCKVGGDFGAVKLIDAALATSAAPSYFPPHDISGMGYFADGGTFANDPVLNGIEVAVAGGHASSITDVEVISIGTGISPEGVAEGDVGQPLDWGVTTWMWPWASGGVPATALLNLTLDLASQNLGKITQNLLKKQITRINPVLTKPVALDEYTAKDYAIMDEAIKSAMASNDWNTAVNMVNSW